MGGGASAGIKAAVATCGGDDLKVLMGDLPQDQRDKIRAALDAAGAAEPPATKGGKKEEEEEEEEGGDGEEAGGEQCQALDEALQAKAAEIRREITADAKGSGKPSLVVGICGSSEPENPDTEELVRQTARQLQSLRPDAVFLTCGEEGVQTAWAQSCTEATHLFHLRPRGMKSGLRPGEDLVGGESESEWRAIFAHVGDVYLCFEGADGDQDVTFVGEGVAEVKIAAARGAAVVPMARCGGASSGKFGFPPALLKCPDGADEAQFALLSNEGAPIEESAAAAAKLAAALGEAAALALEK